MCWSKWQASVRGLKVSVVPGNVHNKELEKAKTAMSGPKIGRRRVLVKAPRGSRFTQDFLLEAMKGYNGQIISVEHFWKGWVTNKGHTDTWQGSAYITLGEPDAPRFKAAMRPLEVMFAFPPGARISLHERGDWARIPQEGESGAISWAEAAAAATAGSTSPGMRSPRGMDNMAGGNGGGGGGNNRAGFISANQARARGSGRRGAKSGAGERGSAPRTPGAGVRGGFSSQGSRRDTGEMKGNFAFEEREEGVVEIRGGAALAATPARRPLPGGIGVVAVGGATGGLSRRDQPYQRAVMEALWQLEARSTQTQIQLNEVRVEQERMASAHMEAAVAQQAFQEGEEDQEEAFRNMIAQSRIIAGRAYEGVVNKRSTRRRRVGSLFVAANQARWELAMQKKTQNAAATIADMDKLWEDTLGPHRTDEGLLGGNDRRLLENRTASDKSQASGGSSGEEDHRRTNEGEAGKGLDSQAGKGDGSANSRRSEAAQGVDSAASGTTRDGAAGTTQVNEGENEQAEAKTAADESSEPLKPKATGKRNESEGDSEGLSEESESSEEEDDESQQSQQGGEMLSEGSVGNERPRRSSAEYGGGKWTCGDGQEGFTCASPSGRLSLFRKCYDCEHVLHTGCGRTIQMDEEEKIICKKCADKIQVCWDCGEGGRDWGGKCQRCKATLHLKCGLIEGSQLCGKCSIPPAGAGGGS